LFFFFFNDTATTEIYTLSLHDALPISAGVERELDVGLPSDRRCRRQELHDRLVGDLRTVQVRIKDESVYHCVRWVRSSV